MSKGEHPENDASNGEDSPLDDSIAKLMRLAGPRRAIPKDVRDRVRASVRKEWRSTVMRRRALRWALPATLAAGVLLALALGGRLPVTEPAPVATIAVTDGGAGAAGIRLRPGDPVYPGDPIVTGGGGVALAFESGLSLRLAARTTATVDAIDEITIDAGKVYADTGPSVRDRRTITVHTDMGSATDHGTQFVVGYDDAVMTVAVREGRVAVAGAGSAYTAAAGDKLTLEPGEEARYDRISAYDSSWNWAAALAPAFDIDQRPVFDFLQWAARETGRELVFASDGARLAARATYLSGTVAGLTPAEAIDAVRPTIPRFDVRVDNQRLIVSIPQ